MLMGGVSAAAEPVWCHEVRSGDTLAGISRRYRAPLAKLLAVNALGNGQALRVGTRLVLPSIRARLGALRAGRPLALRAPAGHLRRENAAATRDGLSRMRDLAMVRRFRRAGRLVPVVAEARSYYVAGVSAASRVARPWTRRFIEQLAGAMHARFETRLRVTSLTRTPASQLALRRVNVNAAPTAGPARSTHLTGAAVDISKRGLAEPEVAWLRTVLGRLKARGLIHAVEEFREPHFHVLVRRGYATYARALPAPILAGGC
jgi:murein DD-endopeptidase MepM/ murein hydrolase activator NlpD